MRALRVLVMVASAPLGAAAPAGASVVPDNPYGAHAMLQPGDSYAYKQVMFAQAAAAGASEIRVDIPLGALFNPWSQTDWTGVDQYMSLARQYHLRVDADLSSVNDPRLTTCTLPGAGQSPFGSSECGVTNLAGYGFEIALVVQHVRGVIDDFEIVNEPDGWWAFQGTPQQYAGMLSTAYQMVHAYDPQGRVLLGGIMSVSGGESWLRQVFATPGYNAAQKFDIANVHLRDTLAKLPGEVASWRRFFAGYGDAAKPLWVTETGYPSNPAFQYDPHFHGHDSASGEAEQAAYLKQALPALLQAGAAKVFWTEEDQGVYSNQFASEGLLGGGVSDPTHQNPYPVIRKPAFYAFSQLAHEAPVRAAIATAARAHRSRSRRHGATALSGDEADRARRPASAGLTPARPGGCAAGPAPPCGRLSVGF